MEEYILFGKLKSKSLAFSSMVTGVCFCLGVFCSRPFHIRCNAHVITVDSDHSGKDSEKDLAFEKKSLIDWSYIFGAFATVSLSACVLCKYFSNRSCTDNYLSPSLVRNYIVVGLNKNGGKKNDRQSVIDFFAKSFNAEGISGFSVFNVDGFWRESNYLKIPLKTPVDLNPSLVIFVDGPSYQTKKIINIVKKFLEPENKFDQLCVLHSVEQLQSADLIYKDHINKII